MRAHVFTDAALAKHAGRFVWLSIDTEKSQNEQFLQRFPVENWPTLFVVDPTSEKAVFKWLGAADVAELEKFFEDAELAMRTSDGRSAEQLLALADRAFAEGHTTEATSLYRQAMQNAPDGWPKRGRAIESLLGALTQARALEDCAHVALKTVPTLPRGPSAANATGMGLECALNAPKDAPWRANAIASLEPWARNALTMPNLLADDRSSLYSALVSLSNANGDKVAARQLASQWVAFLEAEAARAPTAEARAAFDAHRLAACNQLGEPERMLAPLEASERDLPDDFNPPLRLSVVYLRLGRYEDALKAVERAESKVYGPQRLRVFDAKANIYMKKGDRESAERTLQEAIRFAESLPQGERSARAVARLKRSLDEARGSASASSRSVQGR
jgi:tetratricopeptide (TPR) repeat protein